MFEILFKYTNVLRWHKDGPLAADRAVYLREIAVQGVEDLRSHRAGLWD